MAVESRDADAGEFRRVGRYVLCDEIARGGMATVHLGRLEGVGGFARTVAIKRLHQEMARDPDLVAMFLDEARLTSRIQHPNVVQTLDAFAERDELFLVMEYVHGFSLSRLRTAAEGRPVPPGVACAIICDVLCGLDAAHACLDEQGEPLDIVHRDVSPQNILVGSDGKARILDFGIAKAIGRQHVTRDGQVKGKFAYMAPEQVLAVNVTRQCDVFAASIVLWELLTGKRLFRGENEAEILAKVLGGAIPAASGGGGRPDAIPEALDRVVARGLERDVGARFATAQDMATALEGALVLAPAAEVREWFLSWVSDDLDARGSQIRRVEERARKLRADGALPPTQDESTDKSSVASTDVLTQVEDSISRRRARRARTAVALVAGGTGLVVVLAGVRTWRSSETRGTPQVSVQPPTISPPPPADPLPFAAPAAAVSVAPPQVSSVVTSAPSRRPKQSPSAPPPRAAPPLPDTVIKSAPSPASVSSACDPPYSVDAQGHHHYNAACFDK